MALKLRISALLLALLMTSCGDDASPEEAPKDAGRADAGNLDASVRDASTPKDASTPDAGRDAAVAVVDAGADAGNKDASMFEPPPDAGCVLVRCSNPFDCVRNIFPSCGRVTCNMQTTYCE